MNKKKYDIVHVSEDMSKFNFAIGTFACRVFYNASGLSALKDSMDTFMLERFSQRLEDFQHEHDKLSDKEKKEFYDNLKTNKQNQNYLYSFIEGSRKTTYESHSKIYAYLSMKLIKNYKLNYFEDSLFNSLKSFSDFDLKYLHKLLKENKKSPLLTNDIAEASAISKFVNTGVLSLNPINNFGGYDGKKFSINFDTNEFSDELLNLLNIIFED